MNLKYNEFPRIKQKCYSIATHSIAAPDAHGTTASDAHNIPQQHLMPAQNRQLHKS